MHCHRAIKQKFLNILRIKMEVTFMTEQKKLNEFMGLTKEEAKKAQEKHGKNQLIPEKKKTFF